MIVHTTICHPVCIAAGITPMDWIFLDAIYKAQNESKQGVCSETKERICALLCQTRPTIYAMARKLIKAGYLELKGRGSWAATEKWFSITAISRKVNENFSTNNTFTCKESLQTDYDFVKNLYKQGPDFVKNLYNAVKNLYNEQPNFVKNLYNGDENFAEKIENFEAHLNNLILNSNYLFFIGGDEKENSENQTSEKIQQTNATQNSTPNVEDKKNSSPASVDFFHLRAENPIPPSPAAPPFPLPPSEHVPTHRDAQPIAPFKPQEPTTVTDALNDLNSAVKQSMDFLRANPDQLTQWISLSRWVGQRSDIEGTLTAFFGYYQGKQSKEGDAYRNPLVFLTRNFFAWLKNDKPKPKPGQPQYQSQYNQPQPQPANPYKNVRVFGA